MVTHNQAIKALSPADYLIIEKEHLLLHKFLIDLRNTCACSNLNQHSDCVRCDHEKMTSCQGRLPSYLFYISDLAARHFEHEEQIMLSRPHVTEQYEYFRMHCQAHQEIMDKLQALTDACFSMDSTNDPAETYRQFHQELSDMFEEHDRAFDDPFIQSTKT
ncbi:MAG: hypothetical protein WC009_04760 [Methylotenera sp.]